jgi:hypothetical protein
MGWERGVNLIHSPLSCPVPDTICSYLDTGKKEASLNGGFLAAEIAGNILGANRLNNLYVEKLH